ncbi:MAG: hypothetical protein D6775_03650 [Caldilineae bacterium]|nr:MAG: hypothetical protein D6775_03650 [Caldilineae bacterium]
MYAGWWLYCGLLGLGLVLLLASLGGPGPWLGMAVLAVLGLAALLATRRGYGLRRRLRTTLSAEGIHLEGHPHPPPGHGPDFLIPWSEINGLALRPAPGYRQCWLDTSLQPQGWLLVGLGVDLAYEIVEVAGLEYAAERTAALATGTQHIWLRPPA